MFIATFEIGIHEPAARLLESGNVVVSPDSRRISNGFWFDEGDPEVPGQIDSLIAALSEAKALHAGSPAFGPQHAGGSSMSRPVAAKAAGAGEAAGGLDGARPQLCDDAEAFYGLPVWWPWAV